MSSEDASEPGPLACTVRGCGQPLARAARVFACAAGHAFDVARAGHVNLLQPQDRRSLEAGDSRATVEARLRLAEAGADRALHAAVARWLRDSLPDPASESPSESLARAAPRPPPGSARGARGDSVLHSSRAPAALEVGAGPGVLLGALAAALPLRAFGLDLSAPAIERAARAHPGPTWIVANADRRLPFLEGSLDVLLSLRGPKNPAEFSRVLRYGGHLLLGVPAPDDLAELRRATAGEALPRDPAEAALLAFAPHFELAGQSEVRQRLRLDAGGIADLLASTYRGARRAEARRAAELAALEVTQATVLLHWRAQP